MDPLDVRMLTCARIPSGAGEFKLCLFANSDDEKEHLALVWGDVWEQNHVLVRVHSECFHRGCPGFAAL